MNSLNHAAECSCVFLLLLMCSDTKVNNSIVLVYATQVEQKVTKKTALFL